MKHRYTCAILIVFGALLVLACAAQATAPVASPDIVKYSQPPKMGGFDFASMVNGDMNRFIMLDDWVCPDGLPVTDIHWWGSYWVTPSNGVPTAYSDSRPNAATGVDGFVIGIFANLDSTDPGNTYGFDVPDYSTALWEGYFDGSCGETFDFTVVHNAVVYENVYSYGVNLADAKDIFIGDRWFFQEEGVTYWLGIAAVMDDATREWGWHEAASITGAYAVQTIKPVGAECADWYIPCGGHDMAFELTTVPEPGSLLALGAGFSGLLGLIARKRRS